MNFKKRDRSELGLHSPSWWLLILIGLAYLLPVYVVVLGALRRNNDILARPVTWPQNLTLDPIISIFQDKALNLPLAIGFTAARALIVAGVAVIIGAAVSYVLARSKGPTAIAIYVAFMSGIMLPPAATIIPAALVMRTLGLLGSIPGLLLFEFGTHLSLTVFVFVGYIRSIPTAYEEAAWVDGAGRVAAFGRIVFPLMRPIVLTMFVFIAVFTWNDFLNPLIFLGPLGTPTVTTGMYRAVGGLFTVNWSRIFAYTVIVTLPAVGLFLTAQRGLIGGLGSGGLRE